MLAYKIGGVIHAGGLGNHGRRFMKRSIFQAPQTFRSLSGTIDIDISSYDQSQIDQLDDKCILVDENDNILGSSNKLECHLAKNRSFAGEQSPGGLLHRAFSVFLFNSQNELLMQQRSKYKITFPMYYTNTCCSHPRATNLEMNDLDHIGVKLAAQRRMNFELGIPLDQIPIEDIHSITRIRYNSPAGELWAENELDHILLIKKDTELLLNFKEVSNVQFLSEDAVDDFMSSAENEGYKVTPWFKFIYRSFLTDIWKAVKASDHFVDLKNDKIWKAGDIY